MCFAHLIPMCFHIGDFWSVVYGGPWAFIRAHLLLRSVGTLHSISSPGEKSGVWLFLTATALLLSIFASSLHFQVLDGLFHPNLSRFFHILLRLIPVTKEQRGKN